jgi:hypothetical protein
MFEMQAKLDQQRRAQEALGEELEHKRLENEKRQRATGVRTGELARAARLDAKQQRIFAQKREQQAKDLEAQRRATEAHKTALQMSEAGSSTRAFARDTGVQSPGNLLAAASLSPARSGGTRVHGRTPTRGSGSGRPRSRAKCPPSPLSRQQLWPVTQRTAFDQVAEGVTAGGDFAALGDDLFGSGMVPVRASTALLPTRKLRWWIPCKACSAPMATRSKGPLASPLIATKCPSLLLLRSCDGVVLAAQTGCNSRQRR